MAALGGEWALGAFDAAPRATRAYLVDHRTRSRSQSLIEATTTVPWYTYCACGAGLDDPSAAQAYTAVHLGQLDTEAAEPYSASSSSASPPSRPAGCAYRPKSTVDTANRPVYWPRLLAGTDEPGFVGEDDGLNAVPKAQFGQDAAHVGLDCGLGDKEPLGDLPV